MARLDADICRRFKEARREKGISQSLLAARVGCKQSAISAFENGDSTKLSDAIVERLAEMLGVSLEPSSKPVEDVQTPATLSGTSCRGFCPDANCPSNVPYTVGGKLFFRSMRLRSSPGGGKRCACCGEVLEKHCPSCGAPLNDGACCEMCGAPYVSMEVPDGVDGAAWAAARRADIAAIFAMTP